MGDTKREYPRVPDTRSLCDSTPGPGDEVALMEGEGIARKVTLNDGNKMPMFGLGVYKASQEDTVKAVKFALQSGYRLIDTAAFYR